MVDAPASVSVSRSAAGTPRTPLNIAKKKKKNTTSAVNAMCWNAPIPIHRMNSGTSVIFGSANSASIGPMISRATTRESPA